MHYAAYEFRALICNLGFWRGIWIDNLFYERLSTSDCLLERLNTATATEYSVSKSCIVNIYECPLSVVASDPTILIFDW